MYDTQHPDQQLYWGIDPSQTATGLVLLKPGDNEPLFAQKFASDPQKGSLTRALQTADWVVGIIASRPAPQRIAIESYSMASRFKVVTMVELGTVLRLRIAERDWTYLDVAPSALKRFAGIKQGKPTKAVAQLWGWKPKNGDIADAYVLAKIAMATAGHERGLTSSQRDVLGSVRHGVAIACN